MKRLLVGVFVLLVTVAACAIVWWRTPAEKRGINKGTAD